MNFAFANDFKYCTVRIEIIDKKATFLGSGTGFFFDIVEGEKVHSFLITNKHVIEGNKRLRFLVHRAKEDGEVDGGQTFGITIESEHQWILHPDKNVDLAAYPLTEFIKNTQQIGLTPFIRKFTSSLIPNRKEIINFNSIENILMIGYPNSLWDRMHKLPLIRHGVTASDPKIDFNWKSEFVIDAACFPGSSGSPVIIYRPGTWIKQGDSHFKTTVFFLTGVLYAGPQHTAKGDIVIKEIPLKADMEGFMHIPNNLGFVIKSEKLLDFAKRG